MLGNWVTLSSISLPSWEFERRPSPGGVPGMTEGAKRLYPGIAPGGPSVPVGYSKASRSRPFSS
jgi:hypothetical protein